jgi:predicted Zn-dependent peptidase
MGDQGNMVKLNKLDEKNGVSFYHIGSDKFKTVRIDIFLVNPLEKETVSQNALIPHLLKRGSRSYPTQQELARRLEELYGANINVAVYKKGEYQLINISTVFVSDRFTTSQTKLFDEAGSLILEVLTDPVLKDGLFLKDYFEQERENLIQRIRSRVNDKMHYALQRCLEEMCIDEPYAIYEDGDEESVKEITREGLVRQYGALLAESPVFVYISGNVGDSELIKFVNKFDIIDRKHCKPLHSPQVIKEVKKIRRVEEPMDVSQGKLCLGFRTQTEGNSPDYYPLAIYNGILGGGIHSKLFQNVREKESLAYATFSRLEKFKGLMVACSGIEIANRDKTEKIIMEQLKAIEQGDISDIEMEATKKSFVTGLKSMQDNQGALVDFFLSQLLSNQNENMDTFVEKLMSVNKDDVVGISKKITLDTVYFLTSLSGEGTERSE